MWEGVEECGRGKTCGERGGSECGGVLEGRGRGEGWRSVVEGIRGVVEVVQGCGRGKGVWWEG